MARRMYRMKKSPLANRRNRAILVGVVAFALFLIAFGVYSLTHKKSSEAGKAEIKLETGDRPIAKEDAIYVNADGGLSLRSDRNPNSQRITLIPNKTKLVATQELDGWYQVSYNNKTGWVSKQYTTALAPVEDPAKDWGTFTSAGGYKVKYQAGWKSQDYGANATLLASSLVAFSNLDLPATIPEGSEFIAPVTIVISTKAADVANQGFASIAGVQAEAISVGGVAGTKYTYTSTTSNTQMTAIVVSGGGKVFILSEGGGYAEDLLKMAATFTIG